MNLFFAALALAIVAWSRVVEGAQNLNHRWESLQANISSSVPREIVDVSVSEATAVLETLQLGRRSRSQWLHDIGEWHLLVGGNSAQAEDFIFASADLGNANAQFLAGALSVREHEAPGTSQLYYHFASQGGSMAATMALGYRHLFGYDGAPKSCETALRHYKVVADDVMRHNQALHNPSLPIQVFSMPDPVRLSDDQGKMPLRDSDELQSVEYLRRRAMYSTNTELLVRTASLVLFTDLYQSGDVLDALPAKREATMLLQRAADHGSNVAKALLGHVRAYGLTGDKADIQEAILLYEDALNDTASDTFLGQSEAANGLGLIYLHGLGGHSVNIERAMSLFQLSARQGHADGIYNTAKVMGIVDPEKSTQYLEASADVGHVGAVFKLARLREKQRFRGLRDGSHSCEAIVMLCKQVAEHNDYARSVLSHAAKAARNSKYTQALRLYLIAAEMGYEVAEHNAAWIMERYAVSSLRRATKDNKYTRLVKRGVQQRSPDAVVRAGDIEYTLQNYRRAMVHYLHAVDLDPSHAQAQYSLAYMLERGLGTISGVHDLQRARWYYEQVQKNEPLMSYVIGFAKLKIDVELTVRAVVATLSAAKEIVHKLLLAHNGDQSSAQIVYGDTMYWEAQEDSIGPISFVPVMAFNGDSSGIVVEISQASSDDVVTFDAWLWIDASSSTSESQTLFDWQEFVRVDLVRHQDGASWQLRVSSTGQLNSVVTLTNVALPVTLWHHITLCVGRRQQLVTVQVNEDATDSGAIVISASSNRVKDDQKLSIGRRRKGHGNAGGFVGKLWGFRVRTPTSSSRDAEGLRKPAVEDAVLLHLDYDVAARLDETTGRDEVSSRLLNRQREATVMEVNDVALRMVQTPRSTKEAKT